MTWIFLLIGIAIGLVGTGFIAHKNNQGEKFDSLLSMANELSLNFVEMFNRAAGRAFAMGIGVTAAMFLVFISIPMPDVLPASLLLAGFTIHFIVRYALQDLDEAYDIPTLLMIVPTIIVGFLIQGFGSFYGFSILDFSTNALITIFVITSSVGIVSLCTFLIARMILTLVGWIISKIVNRLVPRAEEKRKNDELVISRLEYDEMGQHETNLQAIPAAKTLVQ